jgi:hypothetical protein
MKRVHAHRLVHGLALGLALALAGGGLAHAETDQDRGRPVPGGGVRGADGNTYFPGGPGRLYQCPTDADCRPGAQRYQQRSFEPQRRRSYYDGYGYRGGYDGPSGYYAPAPRYYEPAPRYRPRRQYDPAGGGSLYY